MQEFNLAGEVNLLLPDLFEEPGQRCIVRLLKTLFQQTNSIVQTPSLDECASLRGATLNGGAALQLCEFVPYESQEIVDVRMMAEFDLKGLKDSDSLVVLLCSHQFSCFEDRVGAHLLNA